MSPEDAAKINVSRWIARPKNEDDHRDVRFSTFVIGLLEKNLAPLEPWQWLEVFRIGMERKDIRAALKTLEEVEPTFKATVLLLGTERNILRAVRTGNMGANAVSQLSPKTKIYLMSALFDSVEEFVSTLRIMQLIALD